MNEQLPAPGLTKPVRKTRISKKLKRAIDLWLTGKAASRKDAAEKAGLTQDYFCRALKKPHVGSFVRARAEQNITDATLRASSRVLELLDGQSEHVAGKVALRLLESDGLIAPAGHPAVNIHHHHARPGYTINLGRECDERGAPILTEQEAAQLADPQCCGLVLRPLAKDPGAIDVTPGRPADNQSGRPQPLIIEHQGNRDGE